MTSRPVGGYGRRWLPRAAARRELLVLAVAYLVYEVARLGAVGDRASALATGRDVLRLEAWAGLDVEAWLNAVFGALPVLAVVSCYFYAVCHFLVTPVVLVWLFRTDRGAYARGRTTLLAATAVGFLGHWLLPTAPPRMLPGYEDTMAAWASWGWWNGAGGVPSGMEGLANPVAAMPSLHVGWAVWCGWVLWRTARRRWLRVAGGLYPLATTVVVVGTANHFVLDAVAGAGAVLVGGAVAVVAPRLLRRLASVRPAHVRPAVPAVTRPPVPVPRPARPPRPCAPAVTAPGVPWSGAIDAVPHPRVGGDDAVA